MKGWSIITLDVALIAQRELQGEILKNNLQFYENPTH